MKNPFKKKYQTKSTPLPPRPMKEIEADYAQTAAQAGQAQYLVYVNQRTLDGLNNRLLQINQEADQRKQLDAATPPPAPAAAEQGAKNV